MSLDDHSDGHPDVLTSRWPATDARSGPTVLEAEARSHHLDARTAAWWDGAWDWIEGQRGRR